MDCGKREMDSSADGARRLARGEAIYRAGEAGRAWRVLAGSVRLGQGAEGQFAGLAFAGDVIGAETLLLGRYAFDARALAPCALEPWPAASEQPDGTALLGMLAAAEDRHAQLLRLRSGKAGERIRRLLAILGARGRADSAPARLALPRLKDIADITDLTIETVSRTISRLGQQGVLELSGSHSSRQVAALRPRRPLR